MAEPSVEQLVAALQKADAAGDTAAAQAIAASLKQRQQRPTSVGPVATGEEMAQSFQKPQEQRATSRNPLKWLLGGGETALGVATGMVSSPINETIAGFAQMAPGGRTAEDVMADPPVGTYGPRTAEGEKITNRLSWLMSPVAKALDLGTEAVGRTVAAFNRGGGINSPGIAGGEMTMEALSGVELPSPAGEHFLKAGAGLVPLKGLVRGRFARGRAPTVDELRTQSRALFDAAEQSGAGHIIPQVDLGSFTQKVQSTLANAGARERLHPSTFVSLDELMEEATRPGVAGSSFKSLETMRRVLKNAENAAAEGSDDARLAGGIVDDFDDFIDNQLPQAGGELKQARALWARMLKGQEIEALFEKAKNRAGGYTQSGFENTLRLQFQQLADNPRRFNRFSPDEKAAILEVVRGGNMQKFARWVGKLAPRGPVSAGVTYLLGESVVPGGGLVLAGMGEGARAGATAARVGAANRVSELVRLGAPPSRAPGSRRLPRLDYIPGYSLALPPPAEQR